jgi:hypothetical protein
MKDERLRKFQGWLEAKGDDPHAVLALRRITDFEEYTEEDEDILREFKDWLKSQANTPDVADHFRRERAATPVVAQRCWGSSKSLRASTRLKPSTCLSKSC